jgi:hypothetical protein
MEICNTWRGEGPLIICACVFAYVSQITKQSSVPLKRFMIITSHSCSICVSTYTLNSLASLSTTVDLTSPSIAKQGALQCFIVRCEEPFMEVNSPSNFQCEFFVSAGGAPGNVERMRSTEWRLVRTGY